MKSVTASAAHTSTTCPPFVPSPMNTTRSLFVFSTAAIAFVVAASAHAQNFKFLEVEVLDEHGKPMSEVAVEVKMDGIKFPLATDDLGAVSLNISASDNPVELQVRHPGYQSLKQRWRRAFEVPSEFSFRMKKAPPLQGLVLDPDGQPVAGAEVYTAPPEETLSFLNGRNPEKSEQAAIITDADGKFTLPFPPVGATLACLSDAGWAKLAQTDDEPSEPLQITLIPWAKVRLLNRVERAEAAAETVGLQFVSAKDKDRGRVTWLYEGETDTQGTYACDRVVPGTAMAYRRVPLQFQRAQKRVDTRSHGVLTTINAGEDAEIVLGTAARHATGRLFKPVTYEGKVDWSSGYVVLTENNAVDLVLRTAIFEYGKLLSQSNVMRPEQRVPPSGTPNYLVHYVTKINEDGTFAIPNVPPGQYKFSAVVPAQPKDERNRRDTLQLDERSIALMTDEASETYDLGEHLLTMEQ